MSIGWHITLRLEEDQVLATQREEWVVIGRTLVGVGDRGGLIGAGCADNHAHLGLLCDRPTAGEIVRVILIALTRRCDFPCPFEPPRFRPITDFWHADNTTLYATGQPLRHQTNSDPTREGGSLLDVLGMRVVVPGLQQRVAARVPRVKTDRYVEQLPGQGRWLSTPLPRPLPPEWFPLLPDAIAAAAGHVDLNCGPRWALRRDLRVFQAAAVQLVSPKVPSRVLAPWLGTSASSVRRMRAEQVPLPLQFAVASQLKLFRWLDDEQRAAPPLLTNDPMPLALATRPHAPTDPNSSLAGSPCLG